MIRKIKEEDYTKIVNLFCNNIERNKEYISHGEIQMALAIDDFNLSSDFREIWRKYLIDHVTKKSNIVVFEEDNKILGFVISEVSSDLDHSFGVICDILVQKDIRGKGVGTILINDVLEFFKENNIDQIFIESGLENHSAHDFFEKFGFKCVSKVFVLNKNKN